MRDMLQGVAAVLPPAVVRVSRRTDQNPPAVSAVKLDRPGLGTCRSLIFRRFVEFC